MTDLFTSLSRSFVDHQKMLFFKSVIRIQYRAYCKNYCGRNDINIWGTGIYPYFSPLCKSAAHDLRVSFGNTSERIISFKKVENRDVFYGSNRMGINSGSYTFAPTNVSSYRFFSPYISESILDIASVHWNHLFGEEENHIQECITTTKFPNVKFNTYNKKNYSSKLVAIETIIGDVTLIKAIWAEQKSLPSEKTKLNAGFQCIPNNNTLSIITSLAFRKDAHFFPSKQTVTVNLNESVALNMLENDAHEEHITVWKKDGRRLKYIIPQSVSHDSITLSNVEIGYSGIYSLEYKDYDITKRGYVRLIVRACPKEKYGNLCDKNCSQCMNGGICHDIRGNCICPPGFNGPTCENACAPGFFGQKCNMKCALGSEVGNQACKGALICLPDPYGCSCAAGFYGIFCDKVCRFGTYGAGCSETRNCHCSDGKNCNPFSGVCDGECQSNWYGKHCDETPINISEISFESISPFAVNLTWEESSQPSKTVKYYVITFQQIGWRHLCNFSFDETLNRKNTTETCIVLDDLEPYAIYKINVSAMMLISSKDEYFSNNTRSEIVLKTSAAIPPPPTYFHAYLKTAFSLYLVWASPFPPGGLLDYYKISYVDEKNNSFTDIIVDNSMEQCSNQSSVLCYVMRDLLPNQRYEIQLMAFNKNVSKGSEAVSITVETTPTDPIDDFKVSIVKTHNSEITIQILPGNEYIEIYSAFLIVVNEVDNKHLHHNLSYFIHSESSCSRIPSETNTYIAAKIFRIPESGMQLIVGNKSCLNGYYNQPLKNGKKYRIGIIALAEFCQEKLYSTVLFTNETVSINFVQASRSEPLSISLGFLLPLIIIISIMNLPRGQIYPCSAAKMINNKFKNRYGNILPYDHSRVYLNTEGESNYIHANFVDGYKKSNKYIATQGPMSDTISDFWLMIWNEKVTKIIMITNLVENGKCKCEKYWTDEEASYGDLKLSLRNVEYFADFVIRTFNISKSHKSREIKQFHFTSWPDHGIPLNTTPFINFLKKMRAYNSDCNAPITVHCSDCIFIVQVLDALEPLYYLKIHLKWVSMKTMLISLAIFAICGNNDQYVFVYHALVEVLCVENTCIVSRDFLGEYPNLIIPDGISGTTITEKQFQMLNDIPSQLLPKNILSAYMVSNQSKNRSMHILPNDKVRPLLRRNSNDTDYINAVYIDSYRKKNNFVATQYPLTETVVDFWRMIFELKSKIIVILQDVPVNAQNPQFWPLEGS
ncbi:receptor-type tyrosine-protein phosphatase kappa [Trichonephila inaurata madagascariensis]|uniref:Receptor-type tyrosine-protein phosphatase kappa n=1 Tax=Trichonephila inaurata madagascariensis TaxID=2747483 RepID=A0A8X6WNX2_9ARAC|nr:receptor-type tyrosine-protein phosphatase kappa [Trichonephila inaurata madagascariensis]